MANNPFESQADTNANAFTNPLNPANMNPGWGINPNLLTPSYSAPYRPAYSGSNGMQYGNPGGMTMHQAWNRLKPWSADPMWGNPVMHNDPAVDAMAYRPSDHAMNFAQNFAVPGAALYASMQLGNVAASPYSWLYAREVARGRTAAQAASVASMATHVPPATGIFGRASNFIGGDGSTMMGALGKNMGARFGQGMASGFGMEAAGIGRMAAVGGFAGSVVASAIVPAAIFSGINAIAEKGFFAPYRNTRQSANDLRRNFNGVTFGDATGNAVTGGGLGHLESARMGQEISSQGIRDMTFSTGQYTQIADLSARAGLMDNVGAGGITKRVKEVADQIKMIISISKDPSIVSAVEALASLNSAGASLSGGIHSTAAKVYGQMGRYASAAGVSVQHIMNEAGAQGQYLFQANGMTPYLGQLAAGSTYAAFAGASRMGLIDPAQLARMGGIAGATQASLTGQINSSQTLYNKMALTNSFNGKQGYGPGQSMIGILSQYGNSLAADPFGTMGKTQLHGRAMAGNQIAERGSLATQDQLMSIAGPLGLLGPDGKLDAHKAVPILMGSMGMNEDQANAYLAEMKTMQSPIGYEQKIRAFQKSTAENERQYIAQNYLYGGGLGRPIHAVMTGGNAFIAGVKSVTSDPITSLGGLLGDTLHNVADSIEFGSSLEVARVAGPIRGIAVNEKALAKIKTGGIQDDQRRRLVIMKITQLAEKGDSVALAYLADRSESNLQKVLKTHETFIGSSLAKTFTEGADGYKRLSALSTYIKENVDNSDFHASNDISKIISGDLRRGGSTIDNLNTIGRAVDIVHKSQDDLVGAMADISNIGQNDPLHRVIGDSTGEEAFKKIDALQGKTGALGLNKLGVLASREGLTVEAAMKNPELIKNEDLKQKFKDARTDAERDVILTKYLTQLNGTEGIHKFGNYENMSTADQMGTLQNAAAFDTTISKAYKETQSGQLNFSGFDAVVEKLNAPIKKFSDAVDKFAGDKSPASRPENATYQGFWNSSKQGNQKTP